jgi:hypothetical protein
MTTVTYSNLRPETRAVIRAAKTRHGFLDAPDVKHLATDPATRLECLLVRCGACRFLAPAQDVERLIGYVDQAGDYVRDVSLPATFQYPANT